MIFEFATATRIVLGEGTVKQVPEEVKKLSSKVFVLTGKNLQRATPLLDSLTALGIICQTFPVPSEPTVPMAIEAVEAARRSSSDIVIGYGGGSVIDLGKVVAAMLTNQGDIMTYLEVVGQGQPITYSSVPYIAIPTTAGTGAEVTRNAVLDVPEHKRKVSMRSPLMLPKLAVIDPELTYSLSPELTAYTGLDALTQVIEPFVSHLANPLTDSICREGIRRAARSLRTAHQDGYNKPARYDMALASLFGGLALANAKLGAVHGFAGILGGELQAPHGAICGRLLPYVVEANVVALTERQPENPALNRYHELGHLLTNKQDKTNATNVIDWLQQLSDKLTPPPLSTYGLQEADIPTIAQKSQKASSMKGNPIELNIEELTNILIKAL